MSKFSESHGFFVPAPMPIRKMPKRYKALTQDALNPTAFRLKS